jgi:hypothetical protein
MSEKRRHPRIPVRRAASLEVRTTSPRITLTGEGSTKTIVGAQVQDLSRSGLKIVAPANTPVDKGATVSVKVQVGARTIAIPGNIAWFRRSETEAVAGVRLHLELLDASSRKAIEGWLAEAERAMAKSDTASVV